MSCADGSSYGMDDNSEVEIEYEDSSDAFESDGDVGGAFGDVPTTVLSQGEDKVSLAGWWHLAGHAAKSLALVPSWAIGRLSGLHRRHQGVGNAVALCVPQSALACRTSAHGMLILHGFSPSVLPLRCGLHCPSSLACHTPPPRRGHHGHGRAPMDRCAQDHVEILTVDELRAKYHADVGAIQETLGLSEANAWRALRHSGWCVLGNARCRALRCRTWSCTPSGCAHVRSSAPTLAQTPLRGSQLEACLRDEKRRCRAVHGHRRPGCERCTESSASYHKT